MFFKWIVLGFLIVVCFCEDNCGFESRLYACQRLLSAGKCPKTKQIGVRNKQGECPYLHSEYYVGENEPMICCDNLRTCKSRLDFKLDGNQKPQCQFPRNFNVTMEDNKENHKWLHPAEVEYHPVKKEEKFTIYKECSHGYHCDEDQYCFDAQLKNGTENVLTRDSAKKTLRYCFNKPAKYYMSPGKTCVKDDHDACDHGYCRDTGHGFHMCAHPMQNYCEGQYPAVNHKVECSSNIECKINGTYCGETDDKRKTCCATRPTHVTSNRTCNLGLMVLPRKYCKYENNCGNGGKGWLTSWCDYDSKMCCEINRQEPHWKYYCPDNQTPIYGQPPCNGTGVCYGSARGIEGRCVNGRCCPDMVFNPFFEQYSKLPVMPFITEVPCDPNAQTNWRFAYCDRDSRKMVAFSEYSVSGWPHVIIPMICKSNLDCEVPWFSHSPPVCVHISVRQSYCVATPLKQLLLTYPVWYRRLSGWFQFAHQSWWIVAAILAIYSYWDWSKRNRSAHELN